MFTQSSCDLSQSFVQPTRTKDKVRERWVMKNVKECYGSSCVSLQPGICHWMFETQELTFSLQLGKSRQLGKPSGGRLRGGALRTVINGGFWTICYRVGRMDDSKEGNGNGCLSWRILAPEASWCRIVLPSVSLYHSVHKIRCPREHCRKSNFLSRMKYGVPDWIRHMD